MKKNKLLCYIGGGLIGIALATQSVTGSLPLRDYSKPKTEEKLRYSNDPIEGVYNIWRGFWRSVKEYSEERKINGECEVYTPSDDSVKEKPKEIRQPTNRNNLEGIFDDLKMNRIESDEGPVFVD